MSAYKDGLDDRMVLRRPPWVGAPANPDKGSMVVPMLLGGGLLVLVVGSLLSKSSRADRFAHDSSFGRHGTFSRANLVRRSR